MPEVKFDTPNLIDTIKQSVATEVLEVAPGDYTTREVYRVPLLPHAEPLTFGTLDGLATYIKRGLDKNAIGDGAFLQIASATVVYLKTPIGDAEDRRFVPARAIFDPISHDFGRFLDQERAIINLQTLFVNTNERADLLAKLGNIAHEEEVTQADDGVTQQVVTQRGVKRAEEKIINPVFLRPYRTFHELDQPASPFIVRIRNDDGIEVALFEADGGLWEHACRQAIYDYLGGALIDGSIPILL